MLPNTLIVGAEKSGTTTLTSMLSAHPDVFIPERKEPRYFATYHNENAGLHYASREKGLAWYESLFDGAGDCSVIAEASPAYTWAPDSSETPKRIYDCLGDIKYIYVVRNPIDRMISHYQHALFYRWIPEHISFSDALELMPPLKNCSRYSYQIEQYLPYTSRAQWCVLAFEELVLDFETAKKEVSSFLEIENALPEVLAVKNVTADNYQKPLWLKRIKPVRYLVPSAMRRPGKEFLVRAIGKQIPKPVLNEDARAALAKELLPDVEILCEFYGKDFHSIWKSDFA